MVENDLPEQLPPPRVTPPRLSLFSFRLSTREKSLPHFVALSEHIDEPLTLYRHVFWRAGANAMLGRLG